MGIILIPNDLWMRERTRYPWVADFLCEVATESGAARPDSYYAEQYGVSRKVIRRLFDQWEAESEAD